MQLCKTLQALQASQASSYKNCPAFDFASLRLISGQRRRSGQRPNKRSTLLPALPTLNTALEWIPVMSGQSITDTSSWTWPLLLSTIAGLSTGIGGLLAVVQQPTQGAMAGLLGLAIGVMATVSTVELIWQNALENDPYMVLCSAGAGALAYYLLEPFFPKGLGEEQSEVDGASIISLERKESDGHEGDRGAGVRKELSRRTVTATLLNITSPPAINVGVVDADTPVRGSPTSSAGGASTQAGYLRLGLLMAFTMTLHNMPEGFAVAFSAYTSVGPMMAFAIALHNIPEGIIIAAPIFAATGSRWKAVGLATASGLSEPLGALLALAALRPVITPDRLHNLLAAVGGLMLAVCVIELWPEGRACRNNQMLWLGILGGSLVMGFTLITLN